MSAIEKSRRSVFVLERVKGIEPSFSAWEANVLPLNDTRNDSYPVYSSMAVELEQIQSLCNPLICGVKNGQFANHTNRSKYAETLDT